ncbi:putative hexosaminyltransferase II or mannosyltransferase, NeoF [Xenorhabdus bovienii str. kraussei Quebec]|uniref:Putative hexosaminyltransferase II or mannosyltransferase, NeoF n=1 Tax=Xenorhabdus bovienii str. kraussei Quebec TaxID=1398203 RepID=A0A077PDP9_XENBV|nr:glycosyltransferase [Xenorhabdus bovienii]CDH18742.1 putative hexosaminyltransferase II or mannosyltransferase, NeoF [Xenorhabdus bovienii str. kraussei Quebec]
MSSKKTSQCAVMIERYPDNFDRRGWGGIETAYWNLAHILPRYDVEVIWYSAQEYPTFDNLAEQISSKNITAIVPLMESELFRADQQAPESLRQRTIRVWHDVSLLTDSHANLSACHAHQPGANSADCLAGAVASGAYATDIFFYEAPWTYCFPKRHYIPWAADHIPAHNYHSPSGPVVLLAGKVVLEKLSPVVEACLAKGMHLHILFNNWSKRSKEAKRYFNSLNLDERHKVFDYYDLEQDHERIFGGTSAALILSDYHETFNFLSAEAVQLGIPVVAYSHSGATRRFAAHLVKDNNALLDWLKEDGITGLTPVPRSDWLWNDVGAAYSQLLHNMAARYQ